MFTAQSEIKSLATKELLPCHYYQTQPLKILFGLNGLIQNVISPYSSSVLPSFL